MKKSNEQLKEFKNRIYEVLGNRKISEITAEIENLYYQDHGEKAGQFNSDTARKWLSGTNTPDAPTCRYIERALGVEPGYLGETLGYVTINNNDAKAIRSLLNKDIKQRNKITVYALIAASDEKQVDFDILRKENPNINLSKSSFDKAIPLLIEDHSIEEINGKYRIAQCQNKPADPIS